MTKLCGLTLLIGCQNKAMICSPQLYWVEGGGEVVQPNPLQLFPPVFFSEDKQNMFNIYKLKGREKWKRGMSQFILSPHHHHQHKEEHTGQHLVSTW